MTKDEAKKIFKKWTTNLGLDDWNLTLEFRDINRKQPNESEYADGLSNCNPMYKQAVITLDSNSMAKMTEEVIVHELVHCLTAETHDYIDRNFSDQEKIIKWFDYFNERQTTTIARILVRINKDHGK